MLTDGPLTFRPLVRADFGLLASWLAAPHVRRWWQHDPSPEAVERDFGPGTRGEEPGEDLVVSVGGEPVGLLQRARWHDHPEDLDQVAGRVDIAPGTVELDYLIGRPEHTGRGLGPRIVAAAAAAAWERHPDAPAIVVPVVATNRASWRALEKAGFTRVATIDLTPENPLDPPAHHVLRLDRPG